MAQLSIRPGACTLAWTRAASSGVALSLALLAPLSASAQDGATPREIPKGFVLPGPAPTNAPAGTGSAASPGSDAGSSGGSTVGGKAQNPVDFATAPKKATTDWPCIQRRVDQITAGQIWSGPPLPDPASVDASDEVSRLIDQVAARRTPLADAETAVKDYIEALPKGEREAAAAGFVSVLLDRLNTERSQIMRGIERYGVKQKTLAARLREEAKAFSTQQNNPTANPTALDDARQQMLWNTRVFNERRQSLSYVCEVPTLIEQRAFALGRAAGQAL
ncbi:hypothetical protein [Jiella mangrovi]|uniref:Uncharacterized protein n=1 Tax=Jiella mangrovi TaxID=2821407 RepID=A0ABS4BD77_9HYPH|nr:hypothetical protein [Jiella mangrovi]MBP0614671.1 hypothetical protein [Jiella mangrovi]